MKAASFIFFFAALITIPAAASQPTEILVVEDSAGDTLSPDGADDIRSLVFLDNGLLPEFVLNVDADISRFDPDPHRLIITWHVTDPHSIGRPQWYQGIRLDGPQGPAELFWNLSAPTRPTADQIASPMPSAIAVEGAAYHFDLADFVQAENGRWLSGIVLDSFQVETFAGGIQGLPAVRLDEASANAQPARYSGVGHFLLDEGLKPPGEPFVRDSENPEIHPAVDILGLWHYGESTAVELRSLDPELPPCSLHITVQTGPGTTVEATLQVGNGQVRPFLLDGQPEGVAWRVSAVTGTPGYLIVTQDGSAGESSGPWWAATSCNAGSWEDSINIKKERDASYSFPLTLAALAVAALAAMRRPLP